MQKRAYAYSYCSVNNRTEEDNTFAQHSLSLQKQIAPQVAAKLLVTSKSDYNTKIINLSFKDNNLYCIADTLK